MVCNISNKSIPLSLPSVFTGKTKKHDPVYVAPGNVPTDFSEWAARLRAVESALSQLAGDCASSQDDFRDRLDALADRISRETRERKRVMDSVDDVKDGVQGAIRPMEEVEKKTIQGIKIDQDGRVGDSLVTHAEEGAEMASLKREIKALRLNLAASAAAATPSSSKKPSASEQEARSRLRVLEDRLFEIEGEVKEAKQVYHLISSKF